MKIESIMFVTVALVGTVLGNNIPTALYRPSITNCWSERNQKQLLSRRTQTPLDWFPTCNLLFTYAWNPTQCNSNGMCWCVNWRTGQPLNSHTHLRGQVDCLRTPNYCDVSLNEEYRLCGSKCDNTCQEQNRTCANSCSFTSPYLCNRLTCERRCTCPYGLVRNSYGVCVQVDECPSLPSCNAALNEQFLECPTTLNDTSCSDPQPVLRLLRSCDPRCGCRNGHVRNSQGVCIDFQQCTIDDGITMTVCEAERRIAPNKVECDSEGYFVTQRCVEDECFCVAKYTGKEMQGTRRPKLNYAMNCSYLADCPIGMKFSSCGSLCPSTCDNPTPRCPKVCRINCFCYEGQVFASSSNKTCIPMEDCPSPPEPFTPVSSESSPATATTSTTSAFDSTSANNIIADVRTKSKTKCIEQRDAATSQTNFFDQFIPECDENGLFNSTQCYGFLNECWCVNKTTGMEMEFSRGPTFGPYNIDCDNYRVSPAPPLASATVTPENAEEKETSRPKTVCEIIRDEVAAANVENLYVYECDKNGLYKSKQCSIIFEQCWCVDKETGLELVGSRIPLISSLDIDCDKYIIPPPPVDPESKTFLITSENNSTKRSSKSVDAAPLPCTLKQDLLTAINMQDVFIPACTTDGKYSSKQCDDMTDQCWCVNITSGVELEASRASMTNPDYDIDCDNFAVPPSSLVFPDEFLPDEDDSKQRTGTLLTTCQKLRKEMNTKEFQDAFVPDCDKISGLFNSRQCYGLLGKCWCVNTTTGVELRGSRGSQYNPTYDVDCDNYTVPPLPSINSGNSEVDSLSETNEIEEIFSGASEDFQENSSLQLCIERRANGVYFYPWSLCIDPTIKVIESNTTSVETLQS